MRMQQFCFLSSTDNDENVNAAGRGRPSFGEFEHQPLYDGSRLTLGLTLFTIMSFVVAHHLTGAALQDLLSMLEILLPAGSLLPLTKYLFNNHFSQFQHGVELYVYCSVCNTLLGTSEIVNCTVCEKQYNKKDLINDGCFFMYMKIQDQLEQVLKDEEVQTNLILDRWCHEDILHDIHDGRKYRSFNGGVLTGESNNLSLSMNCDGAPVFNSSTMSIWPVQLILNELPPHLRKKHVTMAGLWFGKNKPPFFSFLSPFTKEMSNLASDGMTWCKDDAIVTSKVFLVVSPVDSIARCALQNLKQFNGAYGCGWCLNKGEVVQKGDGTVRSYDFNDVGTDKRTHNQFIQHAAAALRTNKAVFGVKGPSPLMNVEGFDVVNGFPPDNLHAVFLGVARQLTGLWLDSTNHNEAYYIGRQTKTIDSRLESICPTSELTRLPRSITQRAYWKGSEWRSWLLFYSLVVLKGVLPYRFLHHLMLLVDAVFTLSMDSIRKADIEEAHGSLNKFVFDFRGLYGQKHMSFNLHQLLHLAKAVNNWGPLWSFSTIWFEGHMGFLLKLFKGTRGIPTQIARTFKLWRGLQNWSKKLEQCAYNVPIDIQHFLDRLLHGQVHIQKAESLENDVIMIGVCQLRNLTIQEKYAAEELLDEPVLLAAGFYEKCISKGIVLHSTSYRQTKRVNYYVQLTNGESAVIDSFVNVTTEADQHRSLAFVRYIQFEQSYIAGKDRQSGACAGHIKTVQRLEDVIRAVTTVSIIGKYALITNINGHPGRTIAALPNLIERD